MKTTVETLSKGSFECSTIYNFKIPNFIKGIEIDHCMFIPHKDKLQRKVQK